MEPVPPPPEPQSTLDAIRRRLATVVGRADYRPPYGHEAAAFAAVADALLILLPTTPPPGKHVVDDVPPASVPVEDGDAWEWRDKCVVWWEPEPIEWSDGPRPVALLTGPGREWLTIADARTLAAHLLSAADRAEQADQ